MTGASACLLILVIMSSPSSEGRLTVSPCPGDDVVDGEDEEDEELT